MAWRKPTRDDLTARHSAEEMDAFSSSSGFSPDVADGVLAQAAAFARDAVRSGGRARLSPEDGSIPDGLFRPVLAIAVLDLLNRFSIPPTDARRDAAKAAESYLAEIAAGKIVPESYAAEDAEEAKGAGPDADDGPPRTLGGGLW
jgi:hypothetical protein